MGGYSGECGKTGSIREYCKVGEGDQEGSGPTNNCKEEDSRESGGGDCCQSTAISQNNARGALEGRLASGATTKGNRIPKLNIIGYKSLTKKGGAQAHPMREAWNSVIATAGRLASRVAKFGM